MNTTIANHRLPAAGALLAVLALSLGAPLAHAADPPKDAPAQVSEADRNAMKEDALPPQASIPFADRSITDWAPDGRKGVYIRAQQRWYYARIVGPCTGLDFAQAIGFETGALSNFDRYSQIVVEGQRCMVDSVHQSGPPPRRTKPKPVAPAAGEAKPAAPTPASSPSGAATR